MKLRVVIADGQPLMRTGFKTVLEATGTIEVVGEAGDGEEALRVAEALEPDVVLMDIQMPRLDGIEATRRMPRRRVLILTTFGLDDSTGCPRRSRRSRTASPSASTRCGGCWPAASPTPRSRPRSR